MRIRTVIALVGTSLFVSGLAWAPNFSAPKPILGLETTLAERPYRVRMVATGQNHTGDLNPHGCTDATMIEPHANVNGSFDKERIAATLLSAFLAGRPVRLYMSNTECTTSGGVSGTGTTGRPTFTAVGVE